MGKLTNEMVDKILDALEDVMFDDPVDERGAKKAALRSAGLLEPEETVVEKAKRLCADCRPRDACDILFSEISRLNREAWNDGDMKEANCHGYNDAKMNYIRDFNAWLVERRKQKGSKA